MWIQDLQSLLQVKQVIENLKVIDTSTLTRTEQKVVRDCLGQAYDRANYLLARYSQTSIVPIPWYYLCKRCQQMIPVTLEEYQHFYRRSCGRVHIFSTGEHLACCIPCEIIQFLPERRGKTWDNGFCSTVIFTAITIARSKSSYA